ncbi:hypothetical protein [Longispora urticae]
MDVWQGTGWLDWWANPSTCLGSAEVTLEARLDLPELTATARLVHAADPDELEGFLFLCELDPVFELRLSDESTWTVVVRSTERPAEFTLTRYNSPVDEEIQATLEL